MRVLPFIVYEITNTEHWSLKKCLSICTRSSRKRLNSTTNYLLSNSRDPNGGQPVLPPFLSNSLRLAIRNTNPSTEHTVNGSLRPRHQHQPSHTSPRPRLPPSPNPLAPMRPLQSLSIRRNRCINRSLLPPPPPLLPILQ